MRIQFSDYDAPAELCVATGERLIPLTDPEGARAFVMSAVQSGVFEWDSELR